MAGGRVAHTSNPTQTPGAPFMQSHRMSGPSRGSAIRFPPPNSPHSKPGILKKNVQKVEKISHPKSRMQITTIQRQSTTNSPQIDHEKTPHFRQPPSKT